jgi:hypothetical protein
LPLAALVAVTQQVPALDEVSLPAVIKQSTAEPLLKVYVTNAPPLPPVVVKESGVPKIPEVDVTVNVSCRRPIKVKAMGGDEIDA